ncbi:gp53-like domain-containing protein [Pararhizobium antarcticum]|uniref:Uncharacterized protein n=1 Tax=Pararhizobium antarcticum TaxID=1798805 RepID=A0A657LU60_9HYPH|nr:hypothetical protein [Pararhizobium antarcticum]OJF97563.1 hypothetical protein AX760_16500 [Pararhizobium antarcticum]
MPIATTYNTGTASIANVGTSVTGQGTSWLTSGLQAGDLFWAAGLAVRIASVNSNTSLTLAYGWPGTTRATDTYEVRFTPDATRILAAARELIDMLGNGNVASIAALTSAANKVPYYTGAGASALADFKLKGRDIVNTADMAALLAKLGPVFGGPAPQPVNAEVGMTDGNFDGINVGGVYSITGTWSNGYAGASGSAYTGMLVVYARSFSNHYVQVYYRNNGDVWMRFTGASGGTSWPNAWFKINPQMVGTVAQSSGVATGAIVERGSNANGEYVRFADGTQICWGSITITPVANTPTSGSVTFPASFTSAIKSAQVTANTSAIGTAVLGVSFGSLTNTGMDVFTYRVSTTLTGCNWTVIGRWF